MNRLLKKHIVKGLRPNINQWNNPDVGVNDNGETIIGRPSVGYGDATEFNYAGKTLDAQPWTEDMLRLKDELEWQKAELLGCDKPFTFALCGWYPHPTGIPWHSDTVPTEEDWIACCSFGGSRTFGWREYLDPIKTESNSSKTLTGTIPFTEEVYLLEDGDCFFFNGKSQMTSTHNVPDLLGTSPRINVTFRTGL